MSVKSKDSVKKEGRVFVDYSHELRLEQNPAMRYVWLVLGVLSVAMGILGYILPGLPGTVFILIAAYFFARSSPKFYNWIMNHRIFGTMIRDWREGKGLSLNAKIAAIITILISITVSSFFIKILWLRLVIIACGIGVSIFLITRPTKPSKKAV